MSHHVPVPTSDTLSLAATDGTPDTNRRWVPYVKRRTRSGKTRGLSVHLVRLDLGERVVAECGQDFPVPDYGIVTVDESIPSPDVWCRKCNWDAVVDYAPDIPACAADAEWVVNERCYEGSDSIETRVAHAVDRVSNGYVVTACSNRLHITDPAAYRTVTDDGMPTDADQCQLCDWREVTNGE